MSKDNKHPASFRDPSGFLFTRQGVLYRQINQNYRHHYDRFLESGLYERLLESNLIIPHRPSQQDPPDPSSAYQVIRPERLPFFSYPYEWSFSQLRDAALATLEIQEIALEHEMCLKDSSAYNIQFRSGAPILIDTLSFEHYNVGEPWVAYRQYCQHFLAPLALMALRDVRMGQLTRVHIDGVPLDLASRLLPLGSWLRPSLIMHIHLHAGAQRRFAGTPTRRGRASRSMGRNAMFGLVSSLRSATKAQNWSQVDTDWSDYEAFHNYSPRALEHKETLVAEFLKESRPKTVWDLGANIGRFSRIAARHAGQVIAFDVDPGAVERNYLACKRQGETDILPLLVDLTNPSPAQGWGHKERQSLLDRGPADAAMALALIHHLAIGNNVPLERIAYFFKNLCRHCIVEFVPKEDSQVQKLLSSREDIFAAYSVAGFEAAFESEFVLLRKEPIEDSSRLLYLMRSKP